MNCDLQLRATQITFVLKAYFVRKTSSVKKVQLPLNCSGIMISNSTFYVAIVSSFLRSSKKKC